MKRQEQQLMQILNNEIVGEVHIDTKNLFITTENFYIDVSSENGIVLDVSHK